MYNAHPYVDMVDGTLWNLVLTRGPFSDNQWRGKCLVWNDFKRDTDHCSCISEGKYCTVIDSDQFQAGDGSDFAIDEEVGFGVQNKNRPLGFPIGKK